MIRNIAFDGEQKPGLTFHHRSDNGYSFGRRHVLTQRTSRAGCSATGRIRGPPRNFSRDRCLGTGSVESTADNRPSSPRLRLQSDNHRPPLRPVMLWKDRLIDAFALTPENASYSARPLPSKHESNVWNTSAGHAIRRTVFAEDSALRRPERRAHTPTQRAHTAHAMTTPGGTEDLEAKSGEVGINWERTRFLPRSQIRHAKPGAAHNSIGCLPSSGEGCQSGARATLRYSVHKTVLKRP